MGEVALSGEVCSAVLTLKGASERDITDFCMRHRLQWYFWQTNNQTHKHMDPECQSPEIIQSPCSSGRRPDSWDLQPLTFHHPVVMLGNRQGQEQSRKMELFKQVIFDFFLRCKEALLGPIISFLLQKLL